MKTKLVVLIGILAVFLTTFQASAQSTNPLNFRTPFAFAIGDKLVPAGDYTVRVVSATGTLSFRSPDGNVSVLISSLVTYQGEASDRFRLVFHRYGVHYYISEIWTPGYKAGRTIQPYPGEKEVARKDRPQHVTVYADAIGQ